MMKHTTLEKWNVGVTIDRTYPVVHPEVADSYSVHFCRLDGPARLWNGR